MIASLSMDKWGLLLGGIFMFIRKMTENDIQDVQEIAQMSWNATYDGIIPLHIQTQFLKLAYSTEQLKKRIIHTHFFIAEKDGNIIGFANFSPIQDGVSELTAIYLHPSFQAKGIGTALLQKGIESVGMNKVTVHVEKENVIGMNFYLAKGFQEVSEFTEEFYGHTLRTVKMSLEVS